ncbi:MAG: sensor histidine kinase [Treponemataceae bacterium]
MIKELRRQFVIIIMSLFSVLFYISFIAIIGSFSVEITNGQKKLLEHMQFNRGVTDQIINLIPLHLRSGVFFYVETDANGALLKVKPENFSELDADEIHAILLEIEKLQLSQGRVKNYRFYKIVSGRLYSYAILDTLPFRSAIYSLIKIAGITMIIVWLILFGVSILLSGKAVRIAQNTITKQKIFISDAGHEIKTPLAIIGANVSVLELELGENQWISNIKTEINRLARLTNDLLTLTKLEQYEKNYDVEKIPLSDILNSLALSFEPRCFEEKKNFRSNIDPHIYVMGNQSQLEQLFLIFLDNAVKYSSDKAIIELSLKRNGSKALFSLYNTGKGISEEEKTHVFERFYRTDSSRSHNEIAGFGLGLSIAQEIAQSHNLNITIESEENHWICFSIVFNIVSTKENQSL